MPDSVLQARSCGRMQLSPVLGLHHGPQTPLEATKAKPPKDRNQKEDQNHKGHQEQEEVKGGAPIFIP